MKTDKYLERIGLDRADIKADEAALRHLQLNHLLTVPFENLDIHWKRPIRLDTEHFYRKIVEEKRGGFCYELNGLFNELLKSLGFQTRLVSARVFTGTDFGPEFDHAAIIVTIGEDEYLADVGFGAFTAEPLRFVPDVAQRDREGTFLVRRSDDDYFEIAKNDGKTWVPQYIFRPLGRDISEFTEMCDFHQSSPDSHFTKGKLCSIMTETGRKTLTDTQFIVTDGKDREESAIATPTQFAEHLRGKFGIENHG